jgi:hypothetical protein
MSTRRRVLAAAASALLTPLLVVPLAGPAATAGAHPRGGSLASSVAVDWTRTAVRTIFVEQGSAPPLGALYLSFTSLAVHDAARAGQRHGTRAAAAAVAQAAHDVLVEYFPLSGPALHAELDASLAMVRDGAKEDAGVAIGAAAADAMIASRADDGRFDPQYAYTKAAALGIWPAAAVPGGMAFPWLGFVDPVVDVAPVALDGPDPITTKAYARDYEEVRRLGSVASTRRSAEQTAISQFFAANSIVSYRNALGDLLDAEPMGLLPTTRLFARIDAAVATAFIQTWRLKYDVGFWRPAQAIAAGAVDGNARTRPHPTTWVPLVTNPAYSDYTSGHAAATSPFAQVVRRTFGDDTPLVLKGSGTQRSYATLTALEHDTLNARIWGGLHFRDAMDDGYHLGHTTADRVMAAIR